MCNQEGALLKFSLEIRARRRSSAGLPRQDERNLQCPCLQIQTSAAKGTKASAYLNLNTRRAVLCRNINMPSKPPGQPPRAPSITRADSDTRRPERPARHLSNPNIRSVTVLSTANQMAANESATLKRGAAVAFTSWICARNHLEPV
jgi:hypothetical protein